MTTTDRQLRVTIERGGLSIVMVIDPHLAQCHGGRLFELVTMALDRAEIEPILFGKTNPSTREVMQVWERYYDGQLNSEERRAFYRYYGKPQDIVDRSEATLAERGNLWLSPGEKAFYQQNAYVGLD